MEYYDSHNHLQATKLIPHQATILQDCAASNVKKMVVNGTCEEDWPAVAALAEKHPAVIPAFGLHPWQAPQRSTQWLDNLKAYLQKKPSGLGEIGLDRWVANYDINEQLEVFNQQLQLAIELRLPVTIHCLKAWGLLHEQLSAHPALPKGFLLHSYAGSAEMIPRFAKLGGYFSVSGYSANPRHKRLQSLIKEIPPKRLLLETDAPEMALAQNLNKYPINGNEINHPANITSVYSFVAGKLGMTEQALSKQVTENFNRLFLAV